MLTWVTWVRGLRRCVGCVGQFFTRELRVGYVSENIFYVGHKFYAGCVGQIYFCVSQVLLRESLRGSKCFMWFKNFCVGQVFFCFGQLLFTRRDYFTVLQIIA